MLKKIKTILIIISSFLLGIITVVTLLSRYYTDSLGDLRRKKDKENILNLDSFELAIEFKDFIFDLFYNLYIISFLIKEYNYI